VQPSTDPAASASVEIGKASVSGQVADADKLAAGMQADFTRCYAQGLSADAKAAGSVLVALQVAKDGSVSRADASPSGNVPAKVESCIAEVGAYAAATLEGQPLEPATLSIMESYRQSAKWLMAYTG
jgi:hypothetical protein